MTKMNKKNNNCPFIPKSVKACTEVSPKIPLLVKNVEYTINKKREKLDIGTFEYVMRRMIVVSPKFKNEYLEHSSEIHDKSIMEVFRHDIQMMYWEKEYQRFVEGKRDWSKK